MYVLTCRCLTGRRRKNLSSDRVAVKPEEAVILGRVSPDLLDSDGIQQLWRDGVTATHKKLILQKLHCSSKCDIKKRFIVFRHKLRIKT